MDKSRILNQTFYESKIDNKNKKHNNKKLYMLMLIMQIYLKQFRFIFLSRIQNLMLDIIKKIN